MANRGICVYCGKDVALKKGGTLMKHGAGEKERRARGETTYRGCPGTDTQPKALHQPVKRIGFGANSRRRV